MATLTLRSQKGSPLTNQEVDDNFTSLNTSKLEANQTITLSGDATGSGTTSLAVTLANSGVTAGTYTTANITVDSKGRITSATNGVSGVSSVNSLTGSVILTTSNISEGTNLYYTDARARSSLSFSAGSGGYNSSTGVISIPTNTSDLTNGAGFLTANQTITLSGDATGSGTTSLAITLANSGVTAGTYTNADITVDSKGRITSASNGTGGGGTLPYSTYTYTADGTTTTYLATSNITVNNVLVILDGVTQTPTTDYTVSGSNVVFVTAPPNLAAIQIRVLGDVSSGINFQALTQSLIPAANVTYDLGSANYRWRDLYLSGNTINLGGATITSDAITGIIAIVAKPTVANPNPSALIISPLGKTSAATTSAGTVNFTTVASDLESNPGFSGSYTDLTNKPTLFSGSYSDLTNKPTLFSGSYSDLTNKPDLTGYASTTYVDTAISNLVDSAPAALNTLNELAAALNDDANYASTISTQLSLKANTSSLSAVATSGSYADLTNKPTLFSGSYSDLTNKPTTLSGYGITDAAQSNITISAGTGLSGGGDLTANRTISLANTSVTAGSYTNADITVDAQGRITSASSGSAGGVSSFNTRTGAVTLSSGDVTTALGFTPISTNQTVTLSGDLTGSGTTSITATLANTSVTAGNYTNANITVDAKGRITSASNGTGGGGGGGGSTNLDGGAPNSSYLAIDPIDGGTP